MLLYFKVLECLFNSRLSLKLEPPSPVGSCAGSKESVKEVIAQGASNTNTISPSHKLGSGSLRLQGSCHQGKFIPTHRKCRSLGSKYVISVLNTITLCRLLFHITNNTCYLVESHFLTWICWKINFNFVKSTWTLFSVLSNNIILYYYILIIYIISFLNTYSFL